MSQPRKSDCLAPDLSPLTAYQAYGCRCERCKTGTSAYYRAYKRAARATDAGWVERDRQASRDWKDRNRDRNRARDRAYRAAQRAAR